jgi:hypothetical protein
MLTQVLPADIKVDLTKVPSAQTEHYFVNVNDANPDVEEEVARFKLGVLKLQSLTRFFTLSIVALRISPKKQDPIVNFVKSVFLTFD